MYFSSISIGCIPGFRWCAFILYRSFIWDPADVGTCLSKISVNNFFECKHLLVLFLEFQNFMLGELAGNVIAVDLCIGI